MSNRFNGKIHSSIKKYMNDCTNESMRQKMKYFNRTKYANLLSNIKYTNENNDANSDILNQPTNPEKTNIIQVANNYTYSIVSHFYSKIKTNFFVFLLLIYNNGIRNK